VKTREVDGIVTRVWSLLESTSVYRNHLGRLVSAKALEKRRVRQQNVLLKRMLQSTLLLILAVVALRTLGNPWLLAYLSIFAAIVLALLSEAASNLPILITCAAVHIVSVPSTSCCTCIIASAPVMRVPRVRVSFTAGRVTRDRMGLLCHFLFHWRNINRWRLSGCGQRSSVSSRGSLGQSCNRCLDG